MDKPGSFAKFKDPEPAPLRYVDLNRGQRRALEARKRKAAGRDRAKLAKRKGVKA